MIAQPAPSPPANRPPAPRDGRSLASLCIAILLPPLLVAILHAVGTRGPDPVASAVLTLTQATRIDSDSLEPPDGAGRASKLPLFEARGPASGPAWFRLPFEMAASANAPQAIAVSFRPSLMAFLDGHLLAQSTASELISRGDRGFQLGSRTLDIQVPPQLLRQGPHELVLRLGAPGYDGAALSAARIGPVEALEAQRAERNRMLWARGTVIVAAAALGIFLVLVWAALREEWIYGLAGVQCLLIAVLLSPNLIAEAPLAAPWWRVLLDAADVGAKALLLLLVVRLFEAGPAGAGRWALAYLAAGLAIDGLAAWHDLAWTDFSHPWPWWALGSRAAVLGTATFLACRAAWERGGRRLHAAAVVVGLGAWIWLYVSVLVLVVPGRLPVIDLNYVGYGAWVLLLGAMLQGRHVQSLRREQRARAELERQVRERTAQLEENHAALRASERLRMAALERERLLQEMHDGLGTHLALAKLNAQRGNLTPRDMEKACDDCLQEMRLAVDGLSVADGDLALLLANLRHRFGARLGEAGIELEWSVGDTPLVPALRGTAGADLVRIVQEALSNVIHHAQARRIRIETGLEGKGVFVAIADDGKGMPEAPSEGRGLRNMRARAARLGADISWIATRDPSGAPAGTQLRLSLPLG